MNWPVYTRPMAAASSSLMNLSQGLDTQLRLLSAQTPEAVKAPLSSLSLCVRYKRQFEVLSTPGLIPESHTGVPSPATLSAVTAASISRLVNTDAS